MQRYKMIKNDLDKLNEYTYMNGSLSLNEFTLKVNKVNKINFTKIASQNLTILFYFLF